MTDFRSREDLVEQIVTEVVRRIRTEPRDPAQANESGVAWRCDAKVVSLEVLSSAPPNCRSIELLRRAVLTPAARDELRQRGISWTRRDRNDSAALESLELRLSTVIHGKNVLRVTPEWTGAFDPIDRCTTLEEAARRIQERIEQPSQRVLAVSPMAYELAWLANRCRRVRAVVVDRHLAEAWGERTASSESCTLWNEPPNVCVVPLGSDVAHAIAVLKGT